MSASSTSNPGEASYIRGGGGTQVPVGRILRVIVILAVCTLVALTAFTAVSAAHQRSNDDRLQRDGVPVLVTVTSCLGIGSGVGETTTYYICRGSFTLEGHTYDEVIGGSRVLLTKGQRLAAFTVPGDPKLLAITKGTGKQSSSIDLYTPTIILGVAAVVLLLGLLLWPRFRRNSAQTPSP